MKNRFEIIVRDAGGAETRQAFNLEVVVSAQNHPPQFTSTPRTQARLATPYGYLAKAFDVDGDPAARRIPSRSSTSAR